MKLSRDFTNKVNYTLDNIIPPILRDNKIFMGFFFSLLFGKKKKYFAEFKEKGFFMTRREYEDYYAMLADKHIKRDTDLNKKSVIKILENIIGEKIIDVGCGSGYLCRKIHESHENAKIYGVDIHVPEKNEKNITFQKENIENLSFKDKSFDTVICTHTLEHVQNFEKSITELRRIAKRRLIIVVPRQREYKYTFDLHLRFFPYLHCLKNAMKNPNAICEYVDNDIFYIEDL